jgi:hypothetical protein
MKINIPTGISEVPLNVLFKEMQPTKTISMKIKYGFVALSYTDGYI